MKTRILLENCRVFPTTRESARSILIEDGIIKRLSDSPTQSVEGDARRIDARDCTVLPGLIDAHCHLFEHGSSRRTIDLRAVASITSLRLRLHAHAAKAQHGQWLVGRGWDQEKLSEARFPTRGDIDDITPANPTLLTRICGHLGVVNSQAIGLLGLEAEGRLAPMIDRDEGGSLTGIVREDALSLVGASIRHQDTTVEEDLLTGEYEALKNGITTVHCILSENYLQEIRALKALHEAGQLSLRYRFYLPLSAIDLLEKGRLGLPRVGEVLRLSGMTLFADGSLGARSAALGEPYADAPDSAGTLNYTSERLTSILLKLSSLDLQVAVHAVGDAAISQTLDAFARVGGSSRKNRWRIEHASLTSADLRKRMKELGVCVAVQPHSAASETWAGGRLGGQRESELYAFRSLLQSGLVVAGASDAPVGPLSPILGLWSAMSRGGASEGQSLSLEQALALYTSNAAYLSFDEKSLGTIAERYAADLTILDTDITAMHPAMLRRVNIATTITNGNVAYSYEGVASTG